MQAVETPRGLRAATFSAPMVRALAAGDKTSTRRAVRIDDTPISQRDAERFKRQRGVPTDATNVRYLGVYLKCDSPPGSYTVSSRVDCPYGLPGDELWVKETWLPGEGGAPPTYRADCPDGKIPEAALRGRKSPTRWRSPRFMPKAASRFRLRIEGVGSQRLHHISSEHAEWEGAKSWWDSLTFEEAKARGNAWTEIAVRLGWEKTPPDYRGAFGALWCDINGADSWWKNPLVWVVHFAVVEAPPGSPCLAKRVDGVRQ